MVGENRQRTSPCSLQPCCLHASGQPLSVGSSEREEDVRSIVPLCLGNAAHDCARQTQAGRRPRVPGCASHLESKNAASPASALSRSSRGLFFRSLLLDSFPQTILSPRPGARENVPRQVSRPPRRRFSPQPTSPVGTTSAPSTAGCFRPFFKQSQEMEVGGRSPPPLRRLRARSAVSGTLH